MSHRCLDPGELPDLLALPEEHPRRREAAACARCGSLLQALGTFLAGDPELPAAERAAAERHLAGVMAGFPGLRASAPARVTPPARARLSLRAPGRGWGLGLAAMLGVVALLSARSGRETPGPNGVLRGGPPPAGAPVDMAVAAAPAGADSLSLSWPAIAGADRYLVELFTADLDTLAVLGPLSEPRAAVALSALGPAEPGKGVARVLCRVRALTPAGEVGVSRLAPLSVTAVPGGRGQGS